MELPAPLEHIAVYYRRGSIVARLMRLRRSALQMKHDPFTLMVMADKDGKAEISAVFPSGTVLCGTDDLFLHAEASVLWSLFSSPP